MAIDFEAEGLLDGADQPREREARLELLRELERDGVGLDELRRAVAEGRLALLPAELALGGQALHTPEQVAERAGLDLDFLQRLWRALGLAALPPGEPALDDEDLVAMANVARLRAGGVPDEGLLRIARVLGQATASVADEVTRVIGDAFLRAGDTERDLGLRYAEAARDLQPLLGPAVLHALRLHQRASVRQAVVGSAERRSGALPGTVDTAVCFADLVGFTKLGERVAADELEALAERLAAMALEAAEPPVRLVKTIGDAAMLVSPDTDALLGAALRLVEAAEAEGEELPAVHAGVAHGPALARAGDWYGSAVNLASRVTDFARPGTVVATGAARESANGDWSWSNAGRRRLKGLSEPVVLYRVRPSDSRSDAPAKTKPG